MGKKQRSRLATHLLRVGFYIVAAFWLGFAYAGLVLVSRQETGRHSHLIGWMLLVVVFAVMLVTMDHWVKYLQVILGGGILGGLLATMSGHLLNGRPFPRPTAAAVTALFVGCSLVAGTLAKRKLRLFDRLALVGFLAGVMYSFFKDSDELAGLIGFGLGFSCLLAAWAYDRVSLVNGAPPLPNRHGRRPPNE